MKAFTFLTLCLIMTAAVSTNELESFLKAAKASKLQSDRVVGTWTSKSLPFSEEHSGSFRVNQSASQSEFIANILLQPSKLSSKTHLLKLSKSLKTKDNQAQIEIILRDYFQPEKSVNP